MAKKSKDQDREEELPARRDCSTERVNMRLLLEDPEYAQRRAAIENQAWRAARTGLVTRTGCTRIPVVVHVVYRTAAQNVSQAQIDSQITVLNTDFRRRNTDLSSAPAVFRSLAADTRVEFELATTDPSGNPTDGVTRTSTTATGFTDDDRVKSAATGGADPWPSDRYLNLWVCQLSGGLLGYAQFPGGPAATDGVVVTHTGFGTTGTAAAPFNLGRTATHEVGHWLNLRHIWGGPGTGCSDSDFVADTPNQGGPNYGTPSFPTVSCGNGPNGDMYVNYMDYVDDQAMVMFTGEQVTRMQAALDGPRASIGRPISCEPKFKFADEPVTLKFRDDPIGTVKFRDDPIGTLKFRDDPIGTLKFRDDPIGTVKFRDDPIGTGTKFMDDVATANKFVDDPVGTAKHLDDVKTPGLDKHPGGDVIKQPGGDVIAQPIQPGQPAPFVLATPHHSRAWEAGCGCGGSGAVELAEYEQRLAQYEEALRAYADAETAGQLGEGEQATAQEMYDEYTRLAVEYQRLSGQELT